MSHQLIKHVKKALVGKTIKSVNAEAVNVTTFHFTDGTSIAFEVEGMGFGIYGMVACAACVQPAKRTRKAKP